MTSKAERIEARFPAELKFLAKRAAALLTHDRSRIFRKFKMVEVNSLQTTSQNILGNVRLDTQLT